MGKREGAQVDWRGRVEDGHADIALVQQQATRYEMDHNELIAEEENDGSSFLMNEREAQ